jgi:hypothetical protein
VLTAYEEGTSAGWEVDINVVEAGGAVWEGEGEVRDFDCWGGHLGEFPAGGMG